MKQFASVFAIVCCAALAACDRPNLVAVDPAHSSPAVEVGAAPPSIDRDSADDRYREMLIEKANHLARREIARMSAAELLYRNAPTTHRIVSADLGPNIGVHTKIYRAFNNYEITDIVRSDSYLNPVTYEITYTYDLLATEPRSLSTPDAEKLVRSDAQFKVLASKRMTRRYSANYDGDFEGGLPGLPPRPDFYTLDADSGVGPASAPMPAAPMGVAGMPPGAPTGTLPPAAMPPGMPPVFEDIPGLRMIDPPPAPPRPN